MNRTENGEFLKYMINPNEGMDEKKRYKNRWDQEKSNNIMI